MEKHTYTLSVVTVVMLLMVTTGCVAKNTGQTAVDSPVIEKHVEEQIVGEQPNIILIVVDDQRWDEFGAGGHPYLETPNIDRLANEGTQFTQSYTVSPLCSPNRASLLTGQYISRHGIVDNLARDAASHRLNLFADDLQAVGYRTAHVGKWHMGNDASPRPGYDYWVSFSGQGRSHDPELFENGQFGVVPGYMTDILTSRATDFIQQPSEKPFFLYIGHKAIHPEVKQLDDSSIDFSYGSKYKAAPRHVGRYEDKIYPRRKNAIDSSAKFKGKPVLEKLLEMKGDAGTREKWQTILDSGTSEQTIRDRAEMLLAVDDGLGEIMEALKRQNALDNTVIILTSDNGYFYGEHGLSIERRMPYEEAVHVPLIVWYPKGAKAAQKIDKFALSIDIAPTILELAKANIDPGIQGESLLGLMQEQKPVTPWRDSFLVEYISYEKPMPWLIGTSYKVIRKNNFKYIHWIAHPTQSELYDLDNDPYELDNLAGSPQHQERIKELQDELVLLVGKASGI